MDYNLKSLLTYFPVTMTWRQRSIYLHRRSYSTQPAQWPPLSY